MYTVEFQSNIDGHDVLIVNEFDLVERIMKIKDTFRRAGYSISGSFYKNARRFQCEFQFRSDNEVVSMAIV